MIMVGILHIFTIPYCVGPFGFKRNFHWLPAHTWVVSILCTTYNLDNADKIGTQ